MEKSDYYVLGVMSGTSLDGIDVAFLHFKKTEKWEFEILTAETITYPIVWKIELEKAVALEGEQLDDLNKRYTEYLGEVIQSFITNNRLENIDAICSHGHTVKHDPANRYTLQIGNLPGLAKLTGHRVVCDFRVQDVRLGGQGAPLVPIGDEFLFSEYTYCLNLGGFANISAKKDKQRIAYDICAVNTVLNFYAGKLGKEYDHNGEIARSGTLNKILLSELEQLDFYQQSAPKSLGIEWVNSRVLPILMKYEEDIPSVMHTYCRHIAQQITNNLDNVPNSSVLVTGGGSFNTLLTEMIKQNTKTRLVIPSAKIINYKEALIFGFLGVLKLREEINVLSSVTGAQRDHSSGVIYLP